MDGGGQFWPWMRHWILWLLLLSGVAIPLFAQVGRGVSAIVPDAERLRVGFDAKASTALFVGVRDFDDEAIASVPYAVDDAVDLAHLFALELQLVTPKKVVLAISGEPQKTDSQNRLTALKDAGARVTRANQSKILRYLHWQSKTVEVDGLFLVGMATHGFTQAGQDYLLASDSLLNFPKETGIRAGLLFEALAEANTPRRFALLDACKERLGTARNLKGPAMGQSLSDAIAKAQGQVVLAATTTNGYAYDDLQRQNGVFTAAILDGLRGRASDSSTRFITAGTLANYVNQQVRNWVSLHRPSDRMTKGITRNIEGAGANLPLAAHTLQVEKQQSYGDRKQIAMDKLKKQLGGSLTGQIYERIVEFLNVDTPTEAQFDLLYEIEDLDGSRRTKKRLAAYVEKYIPKSNLEAVWTTENIHKADPVSIEAALNLTANERRRIQQALNTLGFSVGQADGIFGPRTRRAIENLNRSFGRQVTGYLDEYSYNRLLFRANTRQATQTRVEAEHRNQDRMHPSAPVDLSKEPPTWQPPPDPQQEAKAYQAAFDLLQQGRYTEASSAFRTFLAIYSGGSYADNAQYWLGEANYVIKNLDIALKEFSLVVERYPSSSKVPGALLKSGYIYYEKGNWLKARELFNRVIREYAGRTEARLAKKRLERMDR